MTSSCVGECLHSSTGFPTAMANDRRAAPRRFRRLAPRDAIYLRLSTPRTIPDQSGPRTRRDARAPPRRYVIHSEFGNSKNSDALETFRLDVFAHAEQTADESNRGVCFSADNELNHRARRGTTDVADSIMKISAQLISRQNGNPRRLDYKAL